MSSIISKKWKTTLILAALWVCSASVFIIYSLHKTSKYIEEIWVQYPDLTYEQEVSGMVTGILTFDDVAIREGVNSAYVVLNYNFSISLMTKIINGSNEVVLRSVLKKGCIVTKKAFSDTIEIKCDNKTYFYQMDYESGQEKRMKVRKQYEEQKKRNNNEPMHKN